MDPKELREIYAAHQAYWQGRMEVMDQLRDLYMNAVPDVTTSQGAASTPVPKTGQLVNALKGALFLKDPGVVGVPGIYGEGDPELAAAVANTLTRANQEAIEYATLLGILYPGAFLQVYPVEAPNPFDRIQYAALHPWRVIYDHSAPTWKRIAYAGVITELPIDTAAKLYNKRRSDFLGHARLDADPFTAAGTLYVTVVDIWLIADGVQRAWSPDYKGGAKWLYRGETVQVGGREEMDEDVEDEAPQTERIDGLLYSASGTPLCPIVPLLFDVDPTHPLDGVSWVETNKAQLDDLNHTNSRITEMVMRARRLYLGRPELNGDGVRDIMSSDQDSAVVFPRMLGDMPMGDQLMPLPLIDIPRDVIEHRAQLLADLEAATMMPGFTFGKSSGVTATEIGQLAAYADTKLGKMAATLAATVAQAATVAVALFREILGDATEPISLPRPLGTKLINAEQLRGDYQFIAVDKAGTPLSEFAKQQNLERLTPTLMKLGVPPRAILEQYVRTFNLPQEWLETAPGVPNVEAPVDDGGGAAGAPVGGGRGPGLPGA